jgi:DNA-directed RNA polymerase specialized sigma24 family protein
MAWDAVQFRDKDGNPVPEEVRQTLLASIEKALRFPDTDPQVLVDAATGICSNLMSVRNLSAYANRSMFRATRKAYVAERKLAEQMIPILDKSGSCEELTTPPEPIEQQIQLEGMLAILSALERDIYTFRMKGFAFTEIDKKLNLKPRTSEYRYREAQSKLRKLFPPRP